MEFHIARSVREAAQVEDVLFSYTGNVVFANVTAARKLAQALNAAKDGAGGADGEAGMYNAGALFAMGLIDELSHALVARYRAEIDPAVLAEGVRWFTAQVQPERLEQLLLEFTAQFPNVEVFRHRLTAAEWLAGTTEGMPNREAALEELLLLSMANLNPAFKPFQVLFEDTALKQGTAYGEVAKTFPVYFATRPPMDTAIGSLYDALRAPMEASPDSLTGQLDFIREHWTPYLGEELKRVLLAIDTLREEDIAVWMRFHPPGPEQYRHGAPTFGSQGFVGDEYVGFEDQYTTGPDGVKRRRYGTDYQAPLDEYEAFSADQAWMPNVVLMAKSTYVWLEQLSKKYQRHIHRLDQIPDEELRLLADRGVTGLWLIGLWERSTASRTIKRLRGHHDAVASAYSLKSYDIAEDLGGWEAYSHLKHHAAAAGLRLASDMVPNHMGIDSPWVIDHPDWFIARGESPFPAYSFNGPDLSTDSRVEIKLDDHYYDQTDAAVAFRLRHFADNSTRFVYHGNDGTTFAWNDTAQLDYSKAYVREHVIQTILHVARLFPIIRFDAAMVLAKRHVQRLWFPLPGAGGSIPSRAENAMSQEEFDAMMPHEFWREVVDRVAVEVPGTLLLAEAFWMLEGYFVRTLGMHRVYNSAFMNMLRDEENAKYRSYLKKTIEFDPDILKRYVNFMSNPDERTTIDQFGDGDKCFGVATLMSTLPGLPMFGHGQIEGFTERYGMEYKKAKMEEWPNEGLVARHQREIAPLLKNRRIFAGSEHFLLYDFWNGYGQVNENVFAYSNRLDGERSLILFNNKYEDTDGTIHMSVASMDKGSGQLRQVSVADGLGLPYDDGVVVAYKDGVRGLNYLRRAKGIYEHGLSFALHGFECVTLLEWRELRSSAEYPWDRLCDELNGAGAANLEEEIVKLRLKPLHDALREVVSSGAIHRLAALAAELAATTKTPVKTALPVEAAAAEGGEAAEEPMEAWTREAARRFYDRVAESLTAADRLAGKTEGKSSAANKAKAEEPGLSYVEAVAADFLAAAHLPALTETSTSWPVEAATILPAAAPVHAERVWGPILAYVVLRNLPVRDVAALFDRLQLRGVLAEIFAGMGVQGEARWEAAARVRLLLAARPAGALRTAAFFTDPDVRWLTGTNGTAAGTWFNKERFEQTLVLLQLPELLKAGAAPEGSAAALERMEETVAAEVLRAEKAGYGLEAYLGAQAVEKEPERELTTAP